MVTFLEDWGNQRERHIMEVVLYGNTIYDVQIRCTMIEFIKKIYKSLKWHIFCIDVEFW
jgi:hypothetical protein